MPNRNRIYHGVSIGILMLDTRFERFNGDIGNARTWPFPVQYREVREATPNRVTRPEGPDMLDAFKAAADELIDAGVAVYGMPPGSEFQRAIREGDASVPFPTLQREVLETAERTVRADGRVTGLPVFDVVTLVHWFHRSLAPERFVQD
jgi:hypothetical protein